MDAPLTAEAPVRWRVGPLETAAPRALLEGGLAQLDALTTDPVPTLRWYRATSTAVVLGRGQRLGDTTGDDLEAGVEVLHRHSGGGAVLMTPDLLSLDVALPAGHPLLDGDVSSVFLPIGRAWASALGSLGIEGLAVHTGPAQARRSGSPRERLLAAVCFATLGRGEVTAGGRKLVGLSQRRRRHGALVQCGLLRRWRPGPLLAALGADPADPEIARAAVGLGELAGPRTAPDDTAVIEAVTARLTADLARGSEGDGAHG